jgi:hypothetical protein
LICPGWDGLRLAKARKFVGFDYQSQCHSSTDNGVQSVRAILQDFPKKPSPATIASMHLINKEATRI